MGGGCHAGGKEAEQRTISPLSLLSSITLARPSYNYSKGTILSPRLGAPLRVIQVKVMEVEGGMVRMVSVRVEARVIVNVW